MQNTDDDDGAMMVVHKLIFKKYISWSYFLYLKMESIRSLFEKKVSNLTWKNIFSSIHRVRDNWEEVKNIEGKWQATTLHLRLIVVPIFKSTTHKIQLDDVPSCISRWFSSSSICNYFRKWNASNFLFIAH